MRDSLSTDACPGTVEETAEETVDDSMTPRRTAGGLAAFALTVNRARRPSIQPSRYVEALDGSV